MLVTIAIVSLALLQALVIARVLLRPHRDPVQRIAWILLIAGAPVLGMRRRPGETLHRPGAKNAKKTYSKTQPDNAGTSPSGSRTSCPRFFFCVAKRELQGSFQLDSWRPHLVKQFAGT